DEVGRPGETLVAELQRERRLSLVYLAGRGDVPALREQRVRTDRTVAEFRRRATGTDLRNAAGDLLETRINQTLTALEILPSGRGFIDRREVDRSGALGLYSNIVESTYRTFSAIATQPDEDISRDARTLIALGRARETLGQTDAIVAGVVAAGRFADGEHSQLVQIIGTQQYLYAAAVAELGEAERAEYQKLTEGSQFVRLTAMQQQLASKGRTGAPAPVDGDAWQRSYDEVQRQLRDFELDAADDLTRRTTPVAVWIVVRLAVAALLGLAAVAGSLYLALRVGRSLIDRMTRLRATALRTANEGLPSVVNRLRRGEEVDVAAETPALDFGDDELGQVGHAFGQVHRAAVRSAVDEAAVRSGLREAFLNMARRSQTLLQRQLALLDRMERRTTDPDELEDLFRVDHLATRMRRHAEDLVILAGAAAGRGWRNPVPMVDVIRGAISEVEDYTRVDIQAVQSGAVVGRAVGDVIHLLAELIENATSFSPPHTRVHVSGQMVGRGYAIEVEDRGLGMSPEAIEETNRRLADPPDFDPASSSRLGLFVVAQLGARTDVKVQLRPSAYGGVTAIALLPADLVVDGSGALALPPGEPMSMPAAPPAGSSPRHMARSVDDDSVITRPIAPPPVVVGQVQSLADVPAPRRPADDRAVPPIGEDGLPQRVRRPRSAPTTVPLDGAGVVAGDTVPVARTPDQIRAVMSALQSGTARGRRDATGETGTAVGAPPPARDGSDPGGES
ncbi:MAG TPA: nitrate- and nitrite sensing domain-containing protein, partial [Micromonosporaceae bacterium]|nr:nitrate- and nitrite sensing domain-containing protein [Micromonosporaceae bacterium]